MTSPAERGFTLLELLVVLAIAGAALALIASRGPFNRHVDLHEAAAELAQALRETRARAIGSDRPATLTLDLEHDRYRIDSLPERPLGGAFGLSVLTTTGEVRGGRSAGIRFLPDGSSTGGRIELSDRDRRVEIGIDWLSGLVRVANVS